MTALSTLKLGFYRHSATAIADLNKAVRIASAQRDLIHPSKKACRQSARLGRLNRAAGALAAHTSDGPKIAVRPVRQQHFTTIAPVPDREALCTLVGRFVKWYSNETDERR